MMISTKFNEDMIIWHMLFNEDDDHILYMNYQIRSLSSVYLKNLRFLNLETSRHVVG
jgi:hypothetical protein